MKNYGKELILDIHNCDPAAFNRKSIRKYFKELCKQIGMEPCEVCWWDDLHTPAAEKETLPHLVGTSAIQFIKTSNVTIHALDILRKIYINIFSCKDFDEGLARQFSKDWFCGEVVSHHVIERR